MNAFISLLVIIVVLATYHFGLNIILGVLKELVFLFVKNKKQNTFYIYYDFSAPMVITLIPIITIPIIGITSNVLLGLPSLFAIETVFLFILILVEVKLFKAAYSEYKTVKESYNEPAAL